MYIYCSWTSLWIIELDKKKILKLNLDLFVFVCLKTNQALTLILGLLKKKKKKVHEETLEQYSLIKNKPNLNLFMGLVITLVYAW